MVMDSGDSCTSPVWRWTVILLNCTHKNGWNQKWGSLCSPPVSSTFTTLWLWPCLCSPVHGISKVPEILSRGCYRLLGTLLTPRIKSTSPAWYVEFTKTACFTRVARFVMFKNSKCSCLIRKDKKVRMKGLGRSEIVWRKSDLQWSCDWVSQGYTWFTGHSKSTTNSKGKRDCSSSRKPSRQLYQHQPHQER